MTSLFHDEEDRQRWQDPEKILSDICLRPGLTFIDLGCGRGYFSIPAAKIVGKNGKVYCVDKNPSFLEELKRRAVEEDLNNLHLAVGKAENTVLCEECADIVFFAIVLHDFNDPIKVLNNAKRMLKHTGRLINLDWKKEHMNFGPPYIKRFNEKQAKRMIEDVGFLVESIKDTGPYHYLIISRKKRKEDREQNDS